ncbi:hypothetical protein FACS189494_07470 [Spirochaetia bacterium]|nr:hypothetical protein FACS189494_07470 [Spirochaetia bacterium]
MMLNGKKALVTGASSGIGRSIAQRFLAEECEVWGLGTKKPADLTEWIEKSGGNPHWISADLGKLDGVEAVIEAAQKESGGFDVLVNNAGLTRDGLSFGTK